MLKHVTAQQIEQYRNKRMPPQDLLDFSRHLGQCSQCRSQLSNSERVSGLLTGLAAAAKAPEHLSYDQMAAYVDSKAGDIDREIVESHAEMCARCAAELRDLAAFATTLAGEAEPEPVLSHWREMGAISLPKKTKIHAGEDDEKKGR
jgi:predicted anti-sigma-YlaC factor YlaD